MVAITCKKWPENENDPNNDKYELPILKYNANQEAMFEQKGALVVDVTRSQLLEGLKCESQIENNGRVRSRGMLPGLQHFGGVEGRARALGWD